MAEQRYLVTARKYRPQLFNEIVEQEHVTETLGNAITLDRLAHAYLFSGPRGVGKTTAARILAKAINCTTPLDKRGEGGEPCRDCASCQTFEEGRSLNIIEIDAASNNKVEDVRELRDSVIIPPQGSKKKVYIIDEVHMLSNAAFNALLKTLEEPPAHALFIFATTEPHKVLPTILSRCQRFDFRRIGVKEMVAHLQQICEKEAITADEASLMLLAHKGDGALRDALSAFDQAIALCGTALTYKELAQAFGVVDVDRFFEVTNLATAGDSAGMLRLTDTVVAAGYDLVEFLAGLTEHVRNLLVARTMSDTSLIEAPEPVKAQYAQAAESLGESDLLRFLMILSDGEEALKSTSQPRLRLELTLLKLAAMAHTADLREAIELVKQMESAPPAAAAPPAPPPKVAAEPVPPPPVAEAPPEETPQSPPPEEPPPAPEPVAAAPDPAPLSEAPPASPAPEGKSPEPYQDLFGTPALRKTGPPADGGAPEAAAVEAAELTLVAPPAGPVGDVSELKSVWPAYVTAVKADRIHVSALLQHTHPLKVEGGMLHVAVPDDFHKRMLENQREYLLEQLESHCTLVIPTALLFTVHEVAEGEIEATVETTKEVDPYEYFEQKRQENPVIKAIFDQFGGEMVW